MLADDLAEGERRGPVEDGMPLKGSLPGDRLLRRPASRVHGHRRDSGRHRAGGVRVWGIGGIGKTALTLELARRNAWRYPGGIAWGTRRRIAADRGGDAAIRLAELEPASTAKDASSGLVRLMKETPVLMVLDNLETLPSDEHPVLARFLSKVPRNGSRVLVTASSELSDFDDVPGTRSRTLTSWPGRVQRRSPRLPLRPPEGRESPARRYPRMVEGGRVEGKCGLVSRRLSGHPRMMESPWASPVTAGRSRRSP